MGGYRGNDETDAQEASGLLEPEDVLEDDGYGDVLDRGYSPRDSAVVGDDYEEGLEGRLARELPDGSDDEDSDDEDEKEPKVAAWAGETDLLEDFGVSGRTLRKLVEENGEDPGAVLAEAGETVGFGELLDALR